MEKHRSMFPNQLRTVRRLSGYRQKEVARIIQVDPALLCRWENGIAVPTAEQLFKLSVLYNKTPDELLPEDFKAAVRSVKARK